MAFNAGDLVATIRLDGVSRFKSDARSAGDALSQTGRMADRVGAGIRSALGVAAGGMVAAGAAATAYATTLFRTGAAYNTLQQTSRAALNTLLGSAEAANEQMSKLDDFARNSPFSKATFIQAQQQLIGFGVEAQKVIPILGAVQDATAAVGGSNQQIGEIVSILAKISSSGKITAEDLNQLGSRGLDAAALLGEGFGKSAADIRQDITDGAIDAGRAIDVLTAQMTARFGGAAANVKETWSGAVDRISAAQREIGATLAEPFISQQGGGMAITWGNQVADVLRAVLTQTQPVVTIFADRLAPAFAGITRGLDEARVVVKGWDSARLESFLTRAEGYGPAIAALGGALAGWTGSMLAGIPIVGGFVGALNPLTGALAATALSSPEVRDALGELLGAMQPLVSVVADLGKTVAAGLSDGLPVAAAAIRIVAEVARPLVQILGAIPSPVVAAGLAFLALRTNMGGLGDMLKTFGERMAVQRAIAAATGGELGVTGRQVGFVGSAMAVAGAQVRGFGNSLKAAFLSNPIGLILTGVATAASLVMAAFTAQAEEARKAKDAIAAYRDTLTDTGDQTAATAERIQASLEEAFDTSSVLSKQDPMKQFGMNIVAVSDAIRAGGPAYDGLLAKLRELGEETFLASDGMGGTIEMSTQSAVAANHLADEFEKQRDALAAAEQEQREYAEALRAARAEMNDAQRSAERFNTAMEVFNSETSTAAEKARALKQALDELNGGTKTAAELEKQLNDQTRAMADAFAETDEAGNKLAASLVDQSGKIDTTTAAGSRLFEQVNSLNDAMLDSVAAAQESARARGEEHVSIDELQRIYADYTGRLREVAGQAGLSDEQIAGLISTMFNVPAEIAFAISNGGSIDENQLKLYQLAQQIIDTPDGDFDVNNDDIPGLLRMLSDLGYSVVRLPDGSIKVTGQGIDTVLSALGQVEQRVYDRYMNVWVQYKQYGQAPVANGGLFNGGVLAFSRGGMPENPPERFIRNSVSPGVYPGGTPIYKFAESETRWEAFISGKVGEEERNRQVAAEAVRRLGGVAQFGPALGVRAFANGGLSDTAWDWTFALRRGEQATQGQTARGGMSLVDQGRSLARTIGGSIGRTIDKVAYSVDKNLVQLGKRADVTAKQLDQAEKRASEHIEKITSKWTEAVETAADKVDDLRAASSQMASSVAQSIRRTFDLDRLASATTVTESATQTVGGITLSTTSQREVPVSASTFLSGLRGQASRMRVFTEKVKKLTAKGFNAAFVSEVVSMGVDAAEPLIDALLSMSDADVRDTNQLYAAVNAAATQSGQAVADANYGKQLAAAEKSLESIQVKADQQIAAAERWGAAQVAAAQANADRVQAAIERESGRMIDAISNALTAATGREVRRATGGPIIGPGTGTSDSILARLSNGEHVWTAAEVRALGGHDAVRRLRADVLTRSVRAFAAGGPVVRVPSSVSTAVLAAEQPTQVTYAPVVQVLPRAEESVTVQARRAMREAEAHMRRWRH